MIVSPNRLVAGQDARDARTGKRSGLSAAAVTLAAEWPGRERFWRVEPDALDCAGQWLRAVSRQWDERIDRLRALVENEDDG